MTYRYYLRRGLRTGEPVSLFRERSDDSSQEVLVDDGWTATTGLWIYRAGGEIDESDRITEDEAATIADAWGHDLSPTEPTDALDDHRSSGDMPTE